MQEIVLRGYQTEAADACFREWNNGAKSTLVTVPTGGGKSLIFAEVIRRFQPKRAMVIAHRRELIHQARDKITALTGLQCGIEMGDNYVNNSLFGSLPVIISTIQTQSKRMSRFKPQEFGVLVIDEVHHGVADSYQNLIHYYRTHNPDIKILGLTATPDRLDQEALGQICETVAFDYEIEDAIADGWLVDVDQRMITLGSLDLTHVRTTAGDLNGADLAAIMESEKNIQGVVQPTLEYVHGIPEGSLDLFAIPEWPDILFNQGIVRKAIVFTVSVAQAEMLANIFNRVYPEMAGWVCGKTREDLRDETLKRFTNKQTKIMVNVGVLTEGFDDPGVELVAVACPTKSRARYAQMLGRAMRPLPGLVDGLATAEERKAAISASPKKCCIAQGTPVLTDRGLIPIELVNSSMKLWDGIEFVTNSGIVCHGKRKVINYAGIEATPDHKVWTQEGWQTFGKCAFKQIPISVTALGRTPVREADGYYWGNSSQPEGETLRAHRMRLRPEEIQGPGKCIQEEGGMQGLWTASKISKMVMAEMRGRSIEMHQQAGRPVRRLWGPGNLFQFPISQRHGSLGSETSGTSSGNDIGQNRQQWPLRAREFEICNPKDSAEQSQGKCDARSSCFQIGISGIQNLGPSSIQIAETRPIVEGNTRESQRERPIQRKVRVFDILNAGPRNRFTAAGLLVSNCTILDFVGNSGKHKLVSSADILGGRVSPSAIVRVLAKAKGSNVPIRMTEALKEAEEEVQREAEDRRRLEEARKSRLVGKIKYTTRKVSPFDAFDITPTQQRGWDKNKVLSEKQRRVLLRQGINPDEMTYAEGRQMVTELFRRWDKNLCTMRQARLLKSYGYETKEVTMQEATKLIDQLAANGWRRTDRTNHVPLLTTPTP